MKNQTLFKNNFVAHFIFPFFKWIFDCEFVHKLRLHFVFWSWFVRLLKSFKSLQKFMDDPLKSFHKNHFIGWFLIAGFWGFIFCWNLEHHKSFQLWNYFFFHLSIMLNGFFIRTKLNLPQIKIRKTFSVYLLNLYFTFERLPSSCVLKIIYIQRK